MANVDILTLGAPIKTAYEGEVNTNAYTDDEKSKLSGVEIGATANASNSDLRNRSTHTGTQTADTITDGTTNKVFTTGNQTKLAGIETSATANSTDSELRNRSTHTGTQTADTITDGSTNKVFSAAEQTKLAGVSTGATANASNAELRDRATHTGTQISSTISDFDDSVESILEAQKGAANGITPLGGDSKISTSYLPTALTGGLSYQGTWNATSNSPTLTSGSGTNGYYYVVSTGGTTDLDGISSWAIGDWVIYNGTAWQKIDNTDSVNSVNGYTGTVVLAKSDVGLTNVDNTSDANKPVSTATQTALNLKVSSLIAGITGADQVTNLVSLTQSEYDAIVSPAASTAYFIIG